MNENKINAWIQQAVDEVLSGKERDQLDKIMEQNPQLKHRFILMEHVADLLNRVGVIDPPPDLKNNILKRIDRQRYQAHQVKQKSLRYWREWFYKPKPRVALAFCSGIILCGVLIILLLSGWFNTYTGSDLNLIGTIGMSAQPVIEKLYELPLRLGETNGIIKVHRFDQLIWLDLDFSAGKELEIKMNYDPGILHFDQSLLLQSTAMSVQTLDKQILISSKRGGRIVVFFVKNKPPATVIGITIRSGRITWPSEKIELN